MFWNKNHPKQTYQEIEDAKRAQELLEADKEKKAMAERRFQLSLDLQKLITEKRVPYFMMHGISSSLDRDYTPKTNGEVGEAILNLIRQEFEVLYAQKQQHSGIKRSSKNLK